MRKVRLEVDEMFVTALFAADTRQLTMEAAAEAIPFVRDDAEVYQVVVSTIEKLKQMSDMEFRQLDLEAFLQSVEDEEE